MSYAIAAAGTGGHIYPGLAVAEQLVSAGVPHSRVVFLGGDRMEAEIIPGEGFPFVRLELQGLARSLSIRNLRLPLVVWRAVRRAVREIDARRVASVLCMGGYVTVPVAIAARRTGRPLYLHEQNMHAGLANRVAARWADRAFVSFSGTRGIDGDVIGYPLRAGLDRPDGGRARPEALARYGFEDDRPIVGVVGGSLGARTLNDAVTAMSAAWGGGPVHIVHLAGATQRDRVPVGADHPSVNRVVLGFEDRMDLFYSASDLVIARGGRRPDGGGGDRDSRSPGPGRVRRKPPTRQCRGRWWRGGAALVLEESRLASLGEIVVGLLDDPARRRRMSRAALSAARPGAAAELARRMLEGAGDGSR